MRLLAAPISAGSAGRPVFAAHTVVSSASRGQWPVARCVPGMPQGDLGDRRHDIRRDPQAAADMVPGAVVRDQPEERGQRPGAAACPRPRQLRDLLTSLHKLRRAMVRPGRDRLAGEIEADETYVGGPEEGKRGRAVESKAIVAVAAEQRGRGIGRIRLRRVKDVSAESLFAFLPEALEPGLNSHRRLARLRHSSIRRLPPSGHCDQRRFGIGARGHAARPQSRRPAQTLVVEDSPGPLPAPTSRRLPRRIHLPLQSASITGPRPPVPPPRPSGRAHRTGPRPPIITPRISANLPDLED